MEDQYGLFTRLEDAIAGCKEFIEDEEEVEEEILPGWLYYARYDSEGDNVHVEEIILDGELNHV